MKNLPSSLGHSTRLSSPCFLWVGGAFATVLLAIALGGCGNDALVFSSTRVIGAKITISDSTNPTPNLQAGFSSEDFVYMPLVINGKNSELMKDATFRAKAGDNSGDGNHNRGPLNEAKYIALGAGDDELRRDAYSVFSSFKGGTALGTIFGSSSNNTSLGIDADQIFATGVAAQEVAQTLRTNSGGKSGTKNDFSALTLADGNANISITGGNSTLSFVGGSVATGNSNASGNFTGKGNLTLATQNGNITFKFTPTAANSTTTTFTADGNNTITIVGGNSATWTIQGGATSTKNSGGNSTLTIIGGDLTLSTTGGNATLSGGFTLSAPAPAPAPAKATGT